MKEILIVSIGSFFGGGMRYWISKMVQSCTVIAFPFETMAVNVAGCLIIGVLSGLNWREGGWIPIVSAPIARQKSGCCVTGQSP